MMPVGAIFSEDRTHRYALWRCWKSDPKMLQYIGLNPSTANETKNDATIKRLISITKFNGYDGFYMTNLFSIVSRNPDFVVNHPDPIRDNDRHLIEVSKVCAYTVFCWGNFKQAVDRSKKVIDMFPDAYFIDRNINASPKHPLYIPTKTYIKSWKNAFDLIPRP